MLGGGGGGGGRPGICVTCYRRYTCVMCYRHSYIHRSEKKVKVEVVDAMVWVYLYM